MSKKERRALIACVGLRCLGEPLLALGAGDASLIAEHIAAPERLLRVVRPPDRVLVVRERDRGPKRPPSP